MYLVIMRSQNILGDNEFTEYLMIMRLTFTKYFLSLLLPNTLCDLITIYIL